jgi:hypothetical protein
MADLTFVNSLSRTNLGVAVDSMYLSGMAIGLWRNTVVWPYGVARVWRNPIIKRRQRIKRIQLMVVAKSASIPALVPKYTASI